MHQAIRIGDGAAVCEEATLSGTITIGNRVILHPNCRVLASVAPIVIGDRTIVEDHALIENCIPSDPHHQVMTIGTNNLFESGCVIRAAFIGNNNWFEPKAEVREGAIIGNDCIIGSAVVIEQQERVADRTIVVCIQQPDGSRKRLMRPQQEYVRKAHEQMLQKYAETFLDTKQTMAIANNHRVLPSPVP